jgi:hypothetical protein
MVQLFPAQLFWRLWGLSRLGNRYSLSGSTRHRQLEHAAGSKRSTNMSPSCRICRTPESSSTAIPTTCRSGPRCSGRGLPTTSTSPHAAPITSSRISRGRASIRTPFRRRGSATRILSPRTTRRTAGRKTGASRSCWKAPAPDENPVPKRGCAGDRIIGASVCGAGPGIGGQRMEK